MAILVLLFLPSLVSTGGEAMPAPEGFKAFLAALEGAWEGRASITPVGPRPYDIIFKRVAPTRLEGAAHPSPSATHFWSFYKEGETPRLRFLSTFAGNREPLFLRATEEKNGAMIFQVTQPRLEVRVIPMPRNLTILIFLRGRPHVEIHLTRKP
jgi:hypothetical protein